MSSPILSILRQYETTLVTSLHVILQSDLQHSLKKLEIYFYFWFSIQLGLDIMKESCIALAMNCKDKQP